MSFMTFGYLTDTGEFVEHSPSRMKDTGIAYYLTFFLIVYFRETEEYRKNVNFTSSGYK